MKVTLLDLGAGNLYSLEKALRVVLPEADVKIEAEPGAALATDLLVLPGVGAFGQAATRLGSARGELRAALAAGLPCIGICLGKQLLFERSEEGDGAGIGFIEGEVTRLAALRLPHMGWSRLEARVSGLELPAAVYFAHSFACRPADPAVIVATASIEGDTFPAIVRQGNTIGAQFHPEKSSSAGVALLGRLARSVLS